MKCVIFQEKINAEIKTAVILQCAFMSELELHEEGKSPVFSLISQRQLKKIEHDEKSLVPSILSLVLYNFTSYVVFSSNLYIEEVEQEKEQETKTDRSLGLLTSIDFLEKTRMILNCERVTCNMRCTSEV